MSRTPDLVDRSVAACTEDGAWRSGWLGVLWEDENYGYADVQVTASAGAEIVFTVFWEDGLRPMYRIDVSPDGQEMFVLKNYDGWLDEIGLISYDDDGNPLDQDGEPVDPDDVDPFQVVNTAVASDEDAVLIAELMRGSPFAVEEIFTRVMAVVGSLTAYTDRWAHRYLRNSTGEDEPARGDLWRPVDIANSATSFPIMDAGAGPVVRGVGGDRAGSGQPAPGQPPPRLTGDSLTASSHISTAETAIVRLDDWLPVRHASQFCTPVTPAGKHTYPWQHLKNLAQEESSMRPEQPSF